MDPKGQGLTRWKMIQKHSPTACSTNSTKVPRNYHPKQNKVRSWRKRADRDTHHVKRTETRGLLHKSAKCLDMGLERLPFLQKDTPTNKENFLKRSLNLPFYNATRSKKMLLPSPVDPGS